MTFTAPLTSLAFLDAAGVWEHVVGTPLTAIAVLLGAIVLRWLAHRAIKRLVHTAIERAEERARRDGDRRRRTPGETVGPAPERHRQRAMTMGAILRSLSTFVIFAVALLTIMATLGVPLAPVLASAGVGGVALGFGAQSLVKDFLSGIFMIVEDQYGVGDVIDTGEVIGTVEDVTLRVTRLRDGTGVVWYIRNGEIVRIGNRSQGWSMALVDIPVAYDEDIEHVMAVIGSALGALQDAEPWSDRLLEAPAVAGVESVAGGVMTVRVSAKCSPNESFGVTREIRARVKVAFDREGIRGPQLYGPPPGPLPGRPPVR